MSKVIGLIAILITSSNCAPYPAQYPVQYAAGPVCVEVEYSTIEYDNIEYYSIVLECDGVLHTVEIKK